MIDQDGYRENVGIVIVDEVGQVLLAKRCRKKNAWQFPQGGIKDDEEPEQAMYRELAEELGVLAHMVEILAVSKHWYSYRLPIGYWRLESEPLVVGQKQKWFLLRPSGSDFKLNLNYSAKPEFDAWEWVAYREPINRIIEFKREVYQSVLDEFEAITKRL